MTKHTYIYSLVNPEDGQVFYIGKSNRPKARFSNHMLLSKSDPNNHKKNKIRKILRRGYYPELRILEKCDVSKWHEREKYWIMHGTNQGWPLTNIVGGGEGASFGYMYQVARSYLNPSREDFIEAITDIVHPVNHKPIRALDFDSLIKLGQQIAICLFQHKSTQNDQAYQA